VLGDSKLIGFNSNMNEPAIMPPTPGKLTRPRIVMALAVAVIADGLQFLLNAAGWFGPDQIIDTAAALIVIRLLGFHWLLLPTFLVELFPVVDDVPTWTGCVIAVIALRKREQRRFHESTAPPGPTIDV